MFASLTEIVRYRSLLRNLVARDLKVRYKRSAIGVLWTVVNPLLTMIVFTIVFSYFLRFPLQRFPIFFLCGFLVWNFMAQTTSWSSACFLGYAPLIKKIYVPRVIFVLATVISGVVNLLICLVPLAILMVWMGNPFSVHLLFLPVAIVLVAVFSLGLSLILAPLCVMFVDLAQIYTVVLSAWMYLTPIFYPLESVPPTWRLLVEVNPMVYFVEAFRAPVYAGVAPSLTVLLRGGMAALATAVVGWLVFDRYSDRVAYYV